MPVIDFFLQDILGVGLAFWLFPFVLLFPGYVIGYLFNLFSFRKRQILTRYIIAIVVSVANVPILLYWLSLSIPLNVAKLILIVPFGFFLSLIYPEIIRLIRRGLPFIVLGRFQKMSFFAALGWVFFSILMLVDIQWGDFLYNNIISLDFATRVTLVNAITRTGIPPVNPSYFPGRPEHITSLYYFWYILCSIIDQFGGGLVDARMALIAGDAWCGLALMALIALYLKIRNNLTGDSAWKTVLFGIGLLTISGLDIIPALTNMVVTRISYGFAWPAGDIEHWNEQITAWVGSLFWVPHHVAALIACMLGFMVLYFNQDHNLGYKKIPIIIVASLALASAIGLSTWVAIVFSVFWVISILILFIQKDKNNLVLLMVLTGVVALIFASPFLVGIVKGGTGSIGSPIVVEVRRFAPVVPYVSWLPPILENIVYFIFLPVNYLMELGFFLIAGLLWLQEYRNSGARKNPVFTFEIALLCVVVFVCSFIRSSIVASNEIGWRGWLLGQFVLLVWAVDLLDLYPFFTKYEDFVHNLISVKNRIVNTLIIFAVVGFSTSVVDVVLLRFWPILIDMQVVGFPNGLSPDVHLGERTMASRISYEYIRDNLPPNVVVQQNPLTGIDRPSGLYGTRQIAISANAPYNVPLSVLEANMNQISKIFVPENTVTWEKIDFLCRKFFIDILIVNDLDSLWKILPILNEQRTVLYGNRFYSILACGDFASTYP